MPSLQLPRLPRSRSSSPSSDSPASSSSNFPPDTPPWSRSISAPLVHGVQLVAPGELPVSQSASVLLAPSPDNRSSVAPSEVGLGSEGGQGMTSVERDPETAASTVAKDERFRLVVTDAHDATAPRRSRGGDGSPSRSLRYSTYTLGQIEELSQAEDGAFLLWMDRLAASPSASLTRLDACASNTSSPATPASSVAPSVIPSIPSSPDSSEYLGTAVLQPSTAAPLARSPSSSSIFSLRRWRRNRQSTSPVEPATFTPLQESELATPAAVEPTRTRGVRFVSSTSRPSSSHPSSSHSSTSHCVTFCAQPSAPRSSPVIDPSDDDALDPDWQLVSPRTLRDPNAPQSSAAAPLGPSSALKRIVQPRPEVRPLRRLWCLPRRSKGERREASEQDGDWGEGVRRSLDEVRRTVSGHSASGEEAGRPPRQAAPS